ncbi:pH-response regulator protein palA/rim20 [Rhodotorula toruloides]|uniref:BY PROTMAP: gi/472585696/gb/EMS23247.1/ pH signal transduction protein [Rhodosporidium toruloides NP11] gi/647400617/emb/CDR46256.1/ RHTO0S12e02124g1_1 [Rhodosporidium toruloides] n=1 Tax=Rhodotorula toruloides TaxID=5286 RepID=A0A0K3CMB2_RHOTO
MSANNLLALPLKATNSLPSLADDIIAFVASASETTHPAAAEEDARALQALRETALGVGEAAVPLVNLATLTDLTRYYAQLTFAKSRLPPSFPVRFPWYPLFSTPSALPLASGSFSTVSPPIALPDLDYERLAVLYNLAAVHAALGTERRRTDQEGIKAAIASYQNAAGALSLLLDQLGDLQRPSHAATSSVWPADLARPTIEALRDLCLAQAQEVAWQKAVMDRLKNGSVAKLALRVAEFYQQAKQAADGARAGTDFTAPFLFPEDVSRYLAVKAAHFTAVAQYRRSIDDLGANRYGDEHGRLQLADQQLKAAVALGKSGIPPPVLSDLKSLQKTVSENLARATKDNDLIYLATPTPSSILPSIVSATLVKPVIPPELASPLTYLHSQGGGLGEPLLEALVPKETLETLSLWEDRKKTWLDDKIVSTAQELDALSTACLTELQLPAALDAVQQPLGVPSAILTKAAAIKSEGGIARLEAMMKDVRRVAEVNRKLLQEAEDLLAEESAEDAARRAEHGSRRWTLSPSSEIAAPLAQRAGQLSSFLTTASQSDSTVRATFGEWQKVLEIFDAGQEAIARAIPSGDASNLSLAAPQVAAARDLRALLDELEGVQAARKRLVEAARTAVPQADVRGRLLLEHSASPASSGGLASFEPLLEAEMKNLAEPYERELLASDARQQDILSNIKALHEAFVQHRQSQASMREREAALQRFDTAHVKYFEMLTNLKEGLKFYADLSKLAGELRDSVKTFVHARRTEADNHEQALASQEAQAPQPITVPEQVPQTRASLQAAPETQTPRRATRSSARSDGTGGSKTSASTPSRPSARRAATPSRQESRVQEVESAEEGWSPAQGIRFG